MAVLTVDKRRTGLYNPRVGSLVRLFLAAVDSVESDGNRRTKILEDSPALLKIHFMLI